MRDDVYDVPTIKKTNNATGVITHSQVHLEFESRSFDCLSASDQIKTVMYVQFLKKLAD